jgi:RNA polymerase sigma-70 factor (ECF subfamily)
MQSNILSKAGASNPPRAASIQDSEGETPVLTQPLRPALDFVTREDLARAVLGDVDAFERVYRAHVARIHSLARRMAGADRADELTQDVFVRVWQKLSTFRGESAFSTWLHRLAVNVIIERFRSRAAERLRFPDDDDGVFDAAVAAPSAPTDRLALDAAIERLPDGARRIFVLHDVEGYKHEEIAGLLQIAVGTSKAQLHRARLLLRKHLG